MIYTPITPRRYRRRVFGQLWMLALQFILGMGLNLIGSETTGPLHVVYVTVLVLHIVNALGLIEGGIYIVLKRHSWLAHVAAGATGFAFLSGLLTVWTHNDGWSLAMAVGFGAAGWLYGQLYVQADRAVR